MGHSVRVFAGALISLRPFLEASTHAHVFALTPGASVFVVPFTDDLQDDVHALVGTGEWPETGPRLSTGDMTFAGRASLQAKLGYLQTEYFGGIGEQSGVLWSGGQLVLGPMTLANSGDGAGRPKTLRPINSVLRELGISAGGHFDEFDAFGLGGYRSNDSIFERAQQIMV